MEVRLIGDRAHRGRAVHRGDVDAVHPSSGDEQVDGLLQDLHAIAMHGIGHVGAKAEHHLASHGSEPGRATSRIGACCVGDVWSRTSRP